MLCVDATANEWSGSTYFRHIRHRPSHWILELPPITEWRICWAYGVCLIWILGRLTALSVSFGCYHGGLGKYGNIPIGDLQGSGSIED